MLSGAEPARRWSQPVPLVDVVRAAAGRGRGLQPGRAAADRPTSAVGRPRRRRRRPPAGRADRERHLVLAPRDQGPGRRPGGPQRLRARDRGPRPRHDRRGAGRRPTSGWPTRRDRLRPVAACSACTWSAGWPSATASRCSCGTRGTAGSPRWCCCRRRWPCGRRCPRRSRPRAGGARPSWSPRPSRSSRRRPRRPASTSPSSRRPGPTGSRTASGATTCPCAATPPSSPTAGPPSPPERRRHPHRCRATRIPGPGRPPVRRPGAEAGPGRDRRRGPAARRCGSSGHAARPTSAEEAGAGRPTGPARRRPRRQPRTGPRPVRGGRRRTPPLYRARARPAARGRQPSRPVPDGAEPPASAGPAEEPARRHRPAPVAERPRRPAAPQAAAAGGGGRAGRSGVTQAGLPRQGPAGEPGPRDGGRQHDGAHRDRPPAPARLRRPGPRTRSGACCPATARASSAAGRQQAKMPTEATTPIRSSRRRRR